MQVHHPGYIKRIWTSMTACVFCNTDIQLKLSQLFVKVIMLKRSFLLEHYVSNSLWNIQARSQTFLCVCVCMLGGRGGGRGRQIGQILGPFMIMRGLSWIALDLAIFFCVCVCGGGGRGGRWPSWPRPPPPRLRAWYILAPGLLLYSILTNTV